MLQKINDERCQTPVSELIKEKMAVIETVDKEVVDKM
jgi:hypothetical protein